MALDQVSRNSNILKEQLTSVQDIKLNQKRIRVSIRASRIPTSRRTRARSAGGRAQQTFQMREIMGSQPEALTLEALLNTTIQIIITTLVQKN